MPEVDPDWDTTIRKHSNQHEAPSSLVFMWTTRHDTVVTALVRACEERWVNPDVEAMCLEVDVEQAEAWHMAWVGRHGDGKGNHVEVVRIKARVGNASGSA